MFGASGSFVYKMVIKEDGGPNWIGICILGITFLTVFIWRCVVFVPEYTVATRKRFNRVVRDKKTGMPLEYDPLVENPKKPGKQVRSLRFRFYLVNSLVLTECGDRETGLGIDGVTLGDWDFETEISVKWHISRDLGCPTNSFLGVAEGKWPWRKKDELEELVRKQVADTVLKQYDDLGEVPDEDADLTKLPRLSIEDHLGACAASLYTERGVKLESLLYVQRSVAPARRNLQGMLAVAAAINVNVGTQDAEKGAAAASVASVIGFPDSA